MKQLLVIIATTPALGIVIAAGTYFAMTEGWLYAGVCGGLLVAAYLHYSFALDNYWTLFQMSNLHGPDHPNIVGNKLCEQRHRR